MRLGCPNTLQGSHLLQFLLERGQLSAQLRSLNLGACQLVFSCLPSSHRALWEVPSHAMYTVAKCGMYTCVQELCIALPSSLCTSAAA